MTKSPKKLATSMAVEILATFRSPLTNRLTVVGEVINVPINGFWFKRLAQNDCEKTKAKTTKVKIVKKVNKEAQAEPTNSTKRSKK